jgi:hypothetical protein
MTGLRRTNRTPANSVSSVGGSLIGFGMRIFSVPIRTAEDNDSATITQVGGGQRLQRRAEQDDAVTVEAIRCVSCRQHQQRTGCELHQPRKTQLQRAAGERIDLPTYRGPLRRSTAARSTRCSDCATRIATVLSVR